MRYAIWTVTALLPADLIIAVMELATDLTVAETLEAGAMSHNVYVSLGKPDADAFIFREKLLLDKRRAVFTVLFYFRIITAQIGYVKSRFGYKYLLTITEFCFKKKNQNENYRNRLIRKYQQTADKRINRQRAFCNCYQQEQ